MRKRSPGNNQERTDCPDYFWELLIRMFLEKKKDILKIYQCELFNFIKK